MENGVPQDITDIILLPFMLMFFGLVWWILAWNAERTTGRKANWKWGAFFFLFVSMYTGFKFFWAMLDPSSNGQLYRETMRGIEHSRRVVVSHYVAFLFPFVSTVAIAVWAFLDSRMKAARRY